MTSAGQADGAEVHLPRGACFDAMNKSADGNIRFWAAYGPSDGEEHTAIAGNYAFYVYKAIEEEATGIFS
jgi:hypothetical protein